MCAFLVVIDIPNLKNVSHPESLKGIKKTIMNSILIINVSWLDVSSVLTDLIQDESN